MAHNDVELSTQHLEHVGNDDIDIDIDLLTAQQDEDFILEDAASDRDLEDVIVGNDDIMQDEENTSYQMDDADIMQEELVENLQMEDAYQAKDPGSNFTSAEMSHNQGDIPEDYIEGLNGASEAAMGDHTDHAAILNDDEDNQALEVQEPSATNFARRRETGILELPPQLPAGEENGTNEGQPDEQSEDQHASTNPRSPSPKSARPSPQTLAGHEIVSKSIDTVAQGHNGVYLVADQETYMSQPKVIVVWRDAEYDLMAASDADDPDSFFLKDVNLIKEPFSILLAALRDIVLDELNPDDELCLAIEDLGLEVTEMSLTVYDTSFEDVLNLYGKLLRNDGVETLGPLYITMGTKPHFTKRLNSLVAGAANGKGLSELVSWNEGSQEVGTEDQSIDLESNKQQFTDHGNNLGIIDESTDQRSNESGPEMAADENAQEDSGQEIVRMMAGFKPAEEYDQADNDENSNNQTAPHNSISRNEQADLSARSQSANSAGVELTDYPTEDVDEDGDLIDYSDDELLPNEEPMALADSHSLLQTNKDNTQDVKENLRQRSLSPATEQDKPRVLPEEQPDDFANEQSTEYLENGPNNFSGDGNSDHLFGHTVEEDSTVQVWDDEEDFGNESEDGEESSDANKHQVTFEEVEYDDEVTEGNDSAIPAMETMSVQDHFFKEDIVDVEDYDGINQGVKIQASAASTLADDALTSDQNNPAVENDITNEAYVDPDEISYEETEGLNPKYSEQMHIADEITQNGQADGYEEAIHDEISYEDDDRQDLSVLSAPQSNIETSPTTNGQSGKRPRSDAEGATDGGSKHSKRLRS